MAAKKITFPVTIMAMVMVVYPLNTNNVFDPCSDAKVQRWDGFTFGLAFSSKDSFFSDQIQLSPCDSRLSLHRTTAKLAVFRPKDDELTFLTVNTFGFIPVLEFQEGTLVNLHWKKFGCKSCEERSRICINNQQCATPISICETNGGSIDCNIIVQLVFSGTDKMLQVLNPWYEVENL